MHFFGHEFICWNPTIMLCLSVRREVFCTTRYWLVSLSNQGFFIALKPNWSAQLWKWLPWAPLFGGRLGFNYRKDWHVCDKDRSFQRWECCPLWGISTQTHLPCATAQKHIGRARTISIYSFLISADSNAALRNRRENMKHLLPLCLFFFSLSRLV